MLFLTPPLQFNLNAAGAGGATAVTYWLAQSYDAGSLSALITRDMEVDSTGNIYVLSTINSASIGTTQTDFVLTKLNALGVFQWHKLLASGNGEAEGVSTELGGSLAVDGDDNIIVAQTSRDRSGVATITGFVAKISPAGSIIWQKIQNGGGTDQTRTYACIADKSTNDVYVAGQTRGTGATGSYSTYVIKYNSSGIEQWQNIFGTTGGEDSGTGIRLDTNGDVLVSGKNVSGASRGFVAKLSKSTGAISWSRYVGNISNNKLFQDMTIDGDDPIMTGWNQQSSSGSNDVWVVKYNNAGTYQWGNLLGGSASDQGLAVAADGSGNVYVSGLQKSDLAHTSVTETAVLAKYNSSGTIQWQKHFTADNANVNFNKIYGLKFHTDGSLIIAIGSGNGLDIANPPYALTIFKLPADDTLWPSTIGQWSIATSSLTAKSASSTEGSLAYTSNTSGISSDAGTMTLADPSGSFTDVLTDAGI